jgi:hypothetical protein
MVQTGFPLSQEPPSHPNQNAEQPKQTKDHHSLQQIFRLVQSPNTSIEIVLVSACPS